MIRTMPVAIKYVDVVSVFEAIARALYMWQERADQRRQLASMDERLLRDIGLDRMAVANEVSKPFWRA